MKNQDCISYDESGKQINARKAEQSINKTKIKLKTITHYFNCIINWALKQYSH